MTKEVCMALARRDSFYPDIPSERWTRELVEYFSEYGHSLRWLPQLPKKLQTRKLAEKVLKEKPQYFRCYVKKTRIISGISRNGSWNSKNIQGFQPNSMDVKRISSISEIVMTAADTAV